MKLKEFLEQLKDLDPELEIYRPNTGDSDTQSCFNQDMYDSTLHKIIYVSKQLNPYEEYGLTPMVNSDKKVLLIF